MIGSKRKTWVIALGALTAGLAAAAAASWRPVREKVAVLLKPSLEASAAPLPSPTPRKETYYCPMHPEVTSEKPGDCPICGMKLVKQERTAAPRGERKILYYQDPMHPWYRSDKPGIAPDCGMKLVPVYAEEPGSAAAPVPGAVQISPLRQQLLGVTTAPAQYRTLEKAIRTVGRVELDETRIASVHVKVSGWIQKVFVNYEYQDVAKGTPLFSIYSPELLATEEEYLLALKARRTLAQSSFREVAAGGESLLEAARRRLSLWDVRADQIRQLEETGKPHGEVVYSSPFAGHVLERKVFPNQYITPASELYKIADDSVLWVYADVYESEIPFVSVGQEATVRLDAFPGQWFQGRVSFIAPHLMEETRTERVRLEFSNPSRLLKPGMFVNVELRRSLGRQLTVPIDAVLDSGERQIVLVDRGQGYFERREVKVRERTEEFATIYSGLRAGERVVTRANFLIDSESNLRQAITGMAGMPGMARDGGGQPAKETPAPLPPLPGTTPESDRSH